MTKAEKLKALSIAKSLIETGWCKFHRNIPSKGHRPASYCLLGAMEEASGIPVHPSNYIGSWPNGRNLDEGTVNFNDDPETTQEQVLMFLEFIKESERHA